MFTTSESDGGVDNRIIIGVFIGVVGLIVIIITVIAVVLIIIGFKKQRAIRRMLDNNKEVMN